MKYQIHNKMKYQKYKSDYYQLQAFFPEKI